MVHVVLINPHKLKKDEVHDKDLALQVASLVYANLENKKDYSRIDIDFIFEEQYFSNPFYQKIHKFSYQDIADYNAGTYKF